ncbi:MAG TPA: cytochrome C oxidase subunit IV family protein [Chitinophagaceae bacterium]|jgi:cytochrome c oxidase subunit IV|nr:cytochrome C oxidase subunit IV family protein [Chitinophagaceae bacterium]
MEQHTTYTDITHDDSHGGGKKEIWKVTIILSVLTVVELALGFWMMDMQDDSLEKHVVKGVIVILMLAKAFYIVGYFMHLKHEIRNFIMTVVVPMGLFVWFIIAFLSDGNSFKNLRNEYNKEYVRRTTQPSPLVKTEESEKKEEKKGGQE